METILKAEGLSGGYAKEIVIKEISFALKQGDFLGIIGPNGSGKSTLLRLLTRVLKPMLGRVFFEGQEIRSLSLKAFCRKAAFVAQENILEFPYLVREMVLMGRIPHLNRLQFETKEDLRLAEEAMALTDTLQLEAREIDALSSGERQRVVIAKALAQEPVLLFLDEPTSHLDIGHQIQILDLLRKLNKQKRLSIIIVLHDLNLASEYCNRILLLDQGRVFKEGAPEEVLTYQNIESIYKTVVVVEQNPLTHKPYVFLVPKEK